MNRFYVFKDGTKQGSAATRENAIELIRCYQKLETHSFLKAEFSIIEGNEELIPYPSRSSKNKTNDQPER